MKKILFINSPKNDFLADSFLIGLKRLYPEVVYEWPLNKFIYKSPETGNKNSMHGIGFTLYNLLNPEPALEFHPEMNVREFDLIIFGDIYRQEIQFRQLQPFLNFQNTIILDGEDTPALFPYYFPPWKKPYSLFFPRLEKQFIYFKREIVPSKTQYYRFLKLIPKWLAGKIPLPENLIPISFSIPDAKILPDAKPNKTKDFPRHIVDPEVCAAVEGAVSRYAFDNEADYYLDLQQSRFGITTKRGGWDCLRHYEIAANGAVPCFRNLQDKPAICAPHGLEDGKNCISYRSFTELRNRIDALSEMEYQELQRGALIWAKFMECSNVAKKAVEAFLIKVRNSPD
jgi:hypothetical protein